MGPSQSFYRLRLFLILQLLFWTAIVLLVSLAAGIAL